MRKRASLATVGALTGATLSFFCAAGVAEAHFVLQAPNSMYQQDPGSGLPEKSAPCGQADVGGPAAVPSNLPPNVFTEGQSVTVTINEVTPHPGHYRVAVAANQSALPRDPLPSGATACSQATVQSTPGLPIIADNMLVHTSPFSGPQSFTVTLPAGFTCTNCTLQVIELMTDHTPSTNCFYHHCAEITVNAPAGTGTAGTSGGTGGTTGSGTGTAGTTGSGTGAAGTTGSGTGAAGTTGSGTGAAGTTGSGTGAAGTTGSGTGAAGTTGSGTGAAGTTGTGTGTGAAGTTGTGTGAAGTGSTGTAGSSGLGGSTGAGGATSSTGSGGAAGSHGGAAGTSGGGDGNGGCSTGGSTRAPSGLALALAIIAICLQRRRRLR